MSSQKRAVLERFVELLSGYTPLNRAVLATLGGEGLEAKVWKKAGISQKRSYLIERNPARMKRLVQGYKLVQHVYADMASFPNVFKAKLGNEVGLDMFHWDLCGTVESVIRDIRNILPLIAKSPGKCLALTVADQRRNTSLEQEAKLLARADCIFDPFGPKLYQRLLEFHTALTSLPFGHDAEPRKVALRELGVMTHLAEAFVAVIPGKALIPNRLERFIFVSDGFRMRSYFIHFGKETDPGRLAKIMANLIVQAPIYWVDEDHPLKIEHASKEIVIDMTTRSADEVKGILERLEPLLERLDKKPTEDILRLAELARMGPDKSLVQSAIDLLNKAMVGQGGQSAEPRLKKSVKSVKKSLAVEPVNDVSEEPAIYEPADKVREQDEIRLELLRSNKLGKETFMKKVKEIAAKLNIPSSKNPMAVMRGILARARGNFRGEFTARLLARRKSTAEREALVKELAEIYGETTSKLMAQVKKSSFWKNRNA